MDIIGNMQMITWLMPKQEAKDLWTNKADALIAGNSFLNQLR